MNKNGNDQRRALLAAAAETGALQPLTQQATKSGGQIVIVIADTESQPGRGFLQGLINNHSLPIQHRREIRELRAESQTVNLAIPASTFLLLADQAERSVADAVRHTLQHQEVIPVVVMAAGGVMTASALPIDDPDTFKVPEYLRTHKGPIDLFGSAPHTGDAAERARQHRDDRRRRHGMN